MVVVVIVIVVGFSYEMFREPSRQKPITTTITLTTTTSMAVLSHRASNAKYCAISLCDSIAI
jgi:hypothetical protein